MPKKQTKEELLGKIKPKDYLIYGIFDFEKKTLVYVHMDEEQVELEFALSNYDEDRFDIVEFQIRLV
jgi:hypothetical protein